ncbi:MAG: sigma-70 family RNA polymerase sigma factor [Acidobacteria bacterium]|nr:sigma-70 family RNA polymerase sigma factor [Acidobacteriota bacterium]
MLEHEKLVLRTALRMLGRLEDAQDAAQEVFLRLYRHIDGIDRQRGVTSWLYRTTMNVCFDQIRRRRPVESIEWDPPVAATQQTGLELDERRRLVAEGLKTLPERERAAIVLREIEGLETAEVAAIFGSSEVTVRSQVSMGKARLKKWLEGRQ